LVQFSVLATALGQCLYGSFGPVISFTKNLFAMKNETKTFERLFEKRTVAELSTDEMVNVDGGATPLVTIIVADGTIKIAVGIGVGIGVVIGILAS
jgi:hypothetical protein